jgi:hypothetical protein
MIFYCYPDRRAPWFESLEVSTYFEFALSLHADSSRIVQYLSFQFQFQCQYRLLARSLLEVTSTAAASCTDNGVAYFCYNHLINTCSR